ncbi:MAG: SAM-dependent methyltransferase, partial [Candidatus Omnitrophota bacterium]
MKVVRQNLGGKGKYGGMHFFDEEKVAKNLKFGPRFFTETAEAYSLRWDPFNRRIFVGGWQGIKVFDAAGNHIKLPEFYNSSLGPMAIYVKGKKKEILIAAANRIDRHHLETGKKIGEIGHKEKVSSQVPSGIVVDADSGQIFVADDGAATSQPFKCRLIKFNSRDKKLEEIYLEGGTTRLLFKDPILWAAVSSAMPNKYPPKLLSIDPDKLDVIREYVLPVHWCTNTEDIISYQGKIVIALGPWDDSGLLFFDPETEQFFGCKQLKHVEAIAEKDSKLLVIKHQVKIVEYDVKISSPLEIDYQYRGDDLVDQLDERLRILLYPEEKVPSQRDRLLDVFREISFRSYQDVVRDIFKASGNIGQLREALGSMMLEVDEKGYFDYNNPHPIVSDFINNLDLFGRDIFKIVYNKSQESPFKEIKTHLMYLARIQLTDILLYLLGFTDVKIINIPKNNKGEGLIFNWVPLGKDSLGYAVNFLFYQPVELIKLSDWYDFEGEAWHLKQEHIVGEHQKRSFLQKVEQEVELDVNLDFKPFLNVMYPDICEEIGSYAASIMILNHIGQINKLIGSNVSQENINQADVLVGQSYQFFSQRDFKLALINLKAAVVLDPYRYGAYHNMAVIFMENKDVKSMIQACRSVMRINAGFFPAHLNLGNTYYGSGRLREAIKEYLLALRIEPDNKYTDLIRFRLLIAYYKIGDLDKALVQYRQLHSSFERLLPEEVKNELSQKANEDAAGSPLDFSCDLTVLSTPQGKVLPLDNLGLKGRVMRKWVAFLKSGVDDIILSSPINLVKMMYYKDMFKFYYINGKIEPEHWNNDGMEFSVLLYPEPPLDEIVIKVPHHIVIYNRLSRHGYLEAKQLKLEEVFDFEFVYPDFIIYDRNRYPVKELIFQIRGIDTDKYLQHCIDTNKFKLLEALIKQIALLLNVVLANKGALIFDGYGGNQAFTVKRILKFTDLGHLVTDIPLFVRRANQLGITDAICDFKGRMKINDVLNKYGSVIYAWLAKLRTIEEVNGLKKDSLVGIYKEAYRESSGGKVVFNLGPEDLNISKSDIKTYKKAIEKLIFEFYRIKPKQDLADIYFSPNTDERKKIIFNVVNRRRFYKEFCRIALQAIYAYSYESNRVKLLGQELDNTLKKQFSSAVTKTSSSAHQKKENNNTNQIFIRRTFLRCFDIELAALVSLLAIISYTYFYTKFYVPEVDFYRHLNEHILVWFLLIFICAGLHEGVYHLVIRYYKYKKKHQFHNSKIIKKIERKGKRVSRLLFAIFTILGVVLPGFNFNIKIICVVIIFRRVHLSLIGVIKLLFTLSSKDIEKIKRVSYEESPRLILGMIKQCKAALERRLSIRNKKPFMIAWGGWGPCVGKGWTVRKFRDYCNRHNVSNKGQTYVIRGDNCIYHYKDRPDLSYPENTFDIERLKKIVESVFRLEEVFVPIYDDTFRMPLGVSAVALSYIRDKYPIEERAGYELSLLPDKVKGLELKYFLPKGFIDEMIEKVKNNGDDSEQIEKQIKTIKDRSNQPLNSREYLINPEVRIYVDRRTGYLIQGFNFTKEDIVIIEFEQALTFGDIRKYADICVFVSAERQIQEDLFMKRRKKGIRYADFTEEKAIEKFRELCARVNANRLCREGKQYADIIIVNTEYLGRSMQHNIGIMGSPICSPIDKQLSYLYRFITSPPAVNLILNPSDFPNAAASSLITISCSELKEIFFSFKDYIDEILYNPNWGSFARNRIKLGKVDSAFDTFSIVFSPYFGQMIIEYIFREIYLPMLKDGAISLADDFTIFEAGGGTAILANSGVKYSQEKAKSDEQWRQFYNKLRYVIGDRSEGIREKQNPHISLFKDKIESLCLDARDIIASFKRIIKGTVFSIELIDNFAPHKVRLSRNKQDAIIVIPVINRSALEKLQRKLHYSINTRRSIKDGDKIYLSKDDYIRIKNLACQNKELEEFVDTKIGFREEYIPFKYFPELEAYVERNKADFLKNVPEGFVTTAYLSTDDGKYLNGASRIITLGSHIMTIDIGGDNRLIFNGNPLHLSMSPRSAFPDNKFNPYHDPGEYDVYFSVNFTNLELVGQECGLGKIAYGALKLLLESKTGICLDDEKTLEEMCSAYVARKANNALHDGAKQLLLKKGIEYAEEGLLDLLVLETCLKQGQTDGFREMIARLERRFNDSIEQYKKISGDGFKLLVQQKQTESRFILPIETFSIDIDIDPKLSKEFAKAFRKFINSQKEILRTAGIRKVKIGLGKESFIMDRKIGVIIYRTSKRNIAKAVKSFARALEEQIASSSPVKDKKKPYSKPQMKVTRLLLPGGSEIITKEDNVGICISDCVAVLIIGRKGCGLAHVYASGRGLVRTFDKVDPLLKGSKVILFSVQEESQREKDRSLVSLDYIRRYLKQYKKVRKVTIKKNPPDITERLHSCIIQPLPDGRVQIDYLDEEDQMLTFRMLRCKQYIIRITIQAVIKFFKFMAGKLIKLLNWSVPVGRIFGVSIRIHSTGFLWLVFIGYYIYMGCFSYALAVAGMLLSLFLHEFSHIIAWRKVTSPRLRSQITLYIIGCIAEMEGIVKEAPKEMFFAFCGPLCSFVLAGIFWPISLVVDRYEIYFLRNINLLIGLFNLIPAYPMDGGRILRCILYWKSKDYYKASKRVVSLNKFLFYIMVIIAGQYMYFPLFLIAVVVRFLADLCADAEMQKMRQEDKSHKDIADKESCSPVRKKEEALAEISSLFKESFPNNKVNLEEPLDLKKVKQIGIDKGFFNRRIRLEDAIEAAGLKNTLTDMIYQLYAASGKLEFVWRWLGLEEETFRRNLLVFLGIERNELEKTKIDRKPRYLIGLLSREYQDFDAFLMDMTRHRNSSDYWNIEAARRKFSIKLSVSNYDFLLGIDVIERFKKELKIWLCLWEWNLEKVGRIFFPGSCYKVRQNRMRKIVDDLGIRDSIKKKDKEFIKGCLLYSVEEEKVRIIKNNFELFSLWEWISDTKEVLLKSLGSKLDRLISAEDISLYSLVIGFNMLFTKEVRRAIDKERSQPKKRTYTHTWRRYRKKSIASKDRQEIIPINAVNSFINQFVERKVFDEDGAQLNLEKEMSFKLEIKKFSIAGNAINFLDNERLLFCIVIMIYNKKGKRVGWFIRVPHGSTGYLRYWLSKREQIISLEDRKFLEEKILSTQAFFHSMREEDKVGWLPKVMLYPLLVRKIYKAKNKETASQTIAKEIIEEHNIELDDEKEFIESLCNLLVDASSPLSVVPSPALAVLKRRFFNRSDFFRERLGQSYLILILGKILDNPEEVENAFARLRKAELKKILEIICSRWGEKIYDWVIITDNQNCPVSLEVVFGRQDFLRSVCIKKIDGDRWYIDTGNLYLKKYYFKITNEPLRNIIGGFSSKDYIVPDDDVDSDAFISEVFPYDLEGMNEENIRECFSRLLANIGIPQNKIKAIMGVPFSIRKHKDKWQVSININDRRPHYYPVESIFMGLCYPKSFWLSRFYLGVRPLGCLKDPDKSLFHFENILRSIIDGMIIDFLTTNDYKMVLKDGKEECYFVLREWTFDEVCLEIYPFDKEVINEYLSIIPLHRLCPSVGSLGYIKYIFRDNLEEVINDYFYFREIHHHRGFLKLIKQKPVFKDWISAVSHVRRFAQQLGMDKFYVASKQQHSLFDPKQLDMDAVSEEFVFTFKNQKMNYYNWFKRSREYSLVDTQRYGKLWFFTLEVLVADLDNINLMRGYKVVEVEIRPYVWQLRVVIEDSGKKLHYFDPLHLIDGPFRKRNLKNGKGMSLEKQMHFVEEVLGQGDNEKFINILEQVVASPVSFCDEEERQGVNVLLETLEGDCIDDIGPVLLRTRQNEILTIGVMFFWRTLELWGKVYNDGIISEMEISTCSTFALRREFEGKKILSSIHVFSEEKSYRAIVNYVKKKIEKPEVINAEAVLLTPYRSRNTETFNALCEKPNLVFRIEPILIDKSGKA